jgi:hypothetical protein
MNIVFDAGKLTGDAMNQCFLLIQQATRVFANDEVSPSFYYISPRFFLTHMRLQHFTLQNSISNLLRPSDDSWNIAREIVHLLWAYGQDSHSLRKSDLKYWNGTAFYNSFFKLDPDAKGFQVGSFSRLPCLILVTTRFV